MEEISVSEPWFSYICSGKKRIEGRLNKGKFSSLNKKQVIKIIEENTNKSCIVKILNIVLPPLLFRAK